MDLLEQGFHKSCFEHWDKKEEVQTILISDPESQHKMKYIQLTTDWNADPNAPEVKLSVAENRVELEFYLNCLLFDNFKAGDRAIVRFENCHKYCFNGMNDEGYYQGKYRYKYKELPWGEFYQLLTDREIDFPTRCTILAADIHRDRLNHYIFFFKDNCFECVAENFTVEFHRCGRQTDS